MELIYPIRKMFIHTESVVHSAIRHKTESKVVLLAGKKRSTSVGLKLLLHVF